MNVISPVFEHNRMTAGAAHKGFAKLVLLFSQLPEGQLGRQSDLMGPATVYACRREFAFASCHGHMFTICSQKSIFDPDGPAMRFRVGIRTFQTS
jgi:hypothetical protein